MKPPVNAIHEEPVWRDRADFIIAAELPEDGRGEQLWVRQIENRTFEMCCIPFFLYDLALGDIVVTDDRYRLVGVQQHSGRGVIRIWFGKASSRGQSVADHLLKLGALVEWSSRRLLAVDVPNPQVGELVDEYLRGEHNKGGIVLERAAVSSLAGSNGNVDDPSSAYRHRLTC